MRRFLAPVLALLAACCLSTAALAGTQGTQTLSTTVPDPTAPSWTLNIPADTAVPYGDPDTSIGWVTVSGVQNVVDEFIVCEAFTTDFKSGTNTIPLKLLGDLYSGGVCYEQHIRVSTPGNPFELYDGTAPDKALSAEIFALVDPADWAAAAPGSYTATVTYQSWLVPLQPNG